jgi:hypothetical protein
MKKVIGGAALAGLAVLAVVATALATPGSGISTENLLFPGTASAGRFDEFEIKAKGDDYKLKLNAKGLTDVHVVRNTLAADPDGVGPLSGGQTGWHTHPGPSLITVTSGTIWAYDGDDPTCTPRLYSAGQGFVDEGGGHVHVLRNEGSVSASTVAVQLLPAGAVRREDMPQPGNCPF